MYAVLKDRFLRGALQAYERVTVCGARLPTVEGLTEVRLEVDFNCDDGAFVTP